MTIPNLGPIPSIGPIPSGLDPHLSRVRPVAPRTPEGCEQCLQLGSPWVHLRACLTCGHTASCDSSPHRHATAHYRSSGHPVMRSIEEGEAWRWCYVDELAG
jgi:hypothetical protein